MDVLKSAPSKTVLSKVSGNTVEYAKANNFSVRHVIWGDKGKSKDQKFPSHLSNKIAWLGSNIYGWIYLFAN